MTIIGDGNKAATSNTSFLKGEKYAWEIQRVKGDNNFSSHHIEVGITKENISQTEGYSQGMGYPKRGNYLYHANGKNIREGDSSRPMADRSAVTYWKKGETVRIELDLKKGKITFIKAGKVMGSLIVDIATSPCVYYPIISVGDSSKSHGNVYRILD